jgi:hypothetical protein
MPLELGKIVRRLKLLRVRTVASVEEGANPFSKLLSIKSKEAPMPMGGVIKILAKSIAKAGEEAQATLMDALDGVSEDVKARVMAAVASMMQSTPPVQEPLPVEAQPVQAAAPSPAPPVQPAATQPAAKEEGGDMPDKKMQELEAENARLKEELAAKEAAKQKEEILGVAKSFERIPGSAEEHAKLLLAVKSKCGDEAYKGLVETLKKTHGLLDASGGEIGEVTEDAKLGGDKFMTVVKSLSAKYGITEEQAIVMESNNNPKAYEEWAKSQRGGE